MPGQFSTVKLPFGLCKETGDLLHVSSVESGLKCNCICPSCKSDLVANKGKIRTHHFSHYNRVACATGYETGIHLYAKDLLSRHKRLKFPVAVAIHKTLSKVIAISDWFSFDDILLEQPIDGIIPDIIGIKNNKRMLIEIAVTHFCNDQKIAKIREHGISTIEIDLHKFKAIDDLESLDQEILSHAPRQWLFNQKVESVRANLVREYDRRIEIEAEQARKQIEERNVRLRKQEERARRDAIRLIEAAKKYSTTPFSETNKLPTSLDFMRRVSDAGLSQFSDVPVNGDWCFNVEPRYWQSALIDALLLAPIRRNKGVLRFDTKLALDWARNRNFIHPEFCGYIDKFSEAQVRREVSDFHSPYSIIDNYLTTLTRRRIIEPQPEIARWTGKIVWTISDQLLFALEQTGHAPK